MALPFDFMLAFLVIAADVFLVFVVILKDRTELINRLFAYTVFSAVVWTVANYLENEPHLIGAGNIGLALRVDFASAAVFSYFWFLFCFAFPQDGRRLPRRWGLPLLALAAAVAAVSFSPLVVEGISFAETVRYSEGPLFWVYAVYLTGLMGGGFLFLFRKQHCIAEDTQQRRQIRTVLSGFILTLIIAVAINLGLQTLFPIPLWLSRVGIYSLVFLTGFTAYAIVHDQMLNIKVLATELFAVLIILVFVADLALSRSPQEAVFRIMTLGLVILFAVFLIRSVRKEVRRREEKARLAEQLAEISEMKSNFISIASHQLRAPIGGVRSYLTMVHDGDFGPLPPKQKQIMELNIDVLDHTLHVIEMFLNVTKMESGKIELSRKPTNLGELAKSVKDELVLSAARKGLTLRLKVAPGLPRVFVDEEKMRNVIFNLVENAIKYTESGIIDMALRKVNGSVECRVADTGIGIEKGEIPKLFAKFVRAGGGFKVSHGSGLGLYIIKTLVEAHGGRVFVESPGPGKGSAFGFRLPVRSRKTS